MPILAPYSSMLSDCYWFALVSSAPTQSSQVSSACAHAMQFSEVLSEREMRELLHRRNYVLRYLDRLVEEQGYAATVVET